MWLKVLLLVAFCLEYSLNASLSLSEQKNYKNLIEGQGLYGADDDVEILTSVNFKKKIYGVEHAWLVEFYNSWCGFCQRFAPSWKALATDTKAWKGVVAIGAVDCSDTGNSELCREFEIMGYPTLRYFHENYSEDPKNLGDDVEKGMDVEEMKTQLIFKMVTEQKSNRLVHSTSILPYSYPNVLHLFDKHVTAKYAFLIVDEPTSILGPQLTLDFFKHKEIVVRYAFKGNDALVAELKIETFPYVMVLTDNNKSHVFPESLKTREALRTAFIEHVKPDLIIDDAKDTRIFRGKWINAQVPDIASLMEAKSRKALRDKVKSMGDVVFQADLESTLRYSLKQEIGSVRSISDDKLTAVKAYVDVLQNYFPFGPSGKNFLTELSEFLKGKSTVDGIQIAMIVAKHDEKAFSSRHQWIACDGSLPQYRGYPCGLWKLFHFMTVQAMARSNSEPTEVLSAMHGYIKNFFGCEDCSQHFQEMAKKLDLAGVASTNSAVLWLWMAHNQVNKRLAGDATEDPDYPKIVFPTQDNCPACRNDKNEWNYNEVVNYLKNMYAVSNIRYIGADSSVVLPGLTPIAITNRTLYEQLDSSILEERWLSEKDVRT